MALTSSHAHADEAGFIAAKVNPSNGQDVILYNAEEAGFDVADGRYVLVCQMHGATAHETNQRRARTLMGQTEKWCSGCRNAKTPAAKPMRLVPFDMKTTEEQTREMRFAAKLVQGNPEKIALFEHVYGVKPDRYYPDYAEAVVKR